MFPPPTLFFMIKADPMARRQPGNGYRHLVMPGNVGGTHTEKRDLEGKAGEGSGIRKPCAPALGLTHLLQGSVSALIKRE